MVISFGVSLFLEVAGTLSQRTMSEPDPRRDYEEQWGSAGTTRGIRSGRKARASREKYITREAQRLGVEESEVPVIHSGGQSRPLHTPSTWEPNPDSDQEEEQEEVVYPQLSEPIDPKTVQLVPKAKLWSLKKAVIPKATGPASPYEGGRRRVFLEDSGASSSGDLTVAIPAPKSAPAAAASSSVIDLTAAASSSSGVPDLVVERVVVSLDPSVELFFWDNPTADQSITRNLIKCAKDSGVIEKGDCDCVIFDWHQVLDVDRETKKWTNRITPEGLVPSRHIETLWRLRRLIVELKANCEIVICSHIHESEGNKQRLLHSVQQSQLPVGYVFITTERTGPKGKLQTLRTVTSGRLIIFDDNEQILREFLEDRCACCQVRKPKARVFDRLPDECVGWSVSSEPLRSNAEKFVRYFAKNPK